MRQALLAAAALAAALAVVAVPPALAAPPVTLAVIGDTPYGTPQVTNFPSNVAEINADPASRFVIHVGDIKNGSSQCSDAYFDLIRADFDEFTKPLLFTPGDNEWTDCHRANNGGYNPVERLQKLREVFFDAPGQSLGDESKVVDYQRQGYAENVRWQEGAVTFGLVHIVGSNNNVAPWFQQPGQTYTDADRAQQTAEVADRTKRDLQWFDKVFGLAEENGSKAVVIGIQANVWDPFLIVAGPSAFSGFTSLVQRLAKRASKFDGEVLLLDGDSHIYEADKPLSHPASVRNQMYGVDYAVPNLTRITVQGATEGTCKEWLRLTVDPDAAAPFSWQRVHFQQQPSDYAARCPNP